jgi:iron complex transport system permease protein/cobaltochelatase CobN
VDKTDILITNYKKSQRRFARVMIGLSALVAAIFVVGLSVAQYPVGFMETFSILMDNITGNVSIETYDDWIKNEIVINMNVPRLLTGISIGAILSVSGAVMQVVVKNPMADPFTTGISSGGLLGASLFIAYGISVVPFLSGNTAVMVNAFLFSLIPTTVILIVTAFKRNISPTMMILTGIGVMYIFSATSSLVRYSADPSKAAEIYRWSLGSLGRVPWDSLYVVIIAAAIALIAGIAFSSKLNTLSQGDDLAKSLGINIRWFRATSLTICALVTAVTVSLAGSIGFVGLVCPHIARMLVGSNNKLVVPCAAIVGMVMLVGCDILSKVILTYGLPVGAVTALIGSPIFIYMLIKSNRRPW